MKEYIEQHPGSVLFARYASRLADEGRLQEAIDILQQGIKANPYYATGHAVLGEMLFRRDDNERAAESIRTALSLDPQLPGDLLSLGKYLAEDSPEEALICIDNARKYAPGHQEISQLADRLRETMEPEMDLQLSESTEQALKDIETGEPPSLDVEDLRGSEDEMLAALVSDSSESSAADLAQERDEAIDALLDDTDEEPEASGGEEFLIVEEEEAPADAAVTGDSAGETGEEPAAESAETAESPETIEIAEPEDIAELEEITESLDTAELEETTELQESTEPPEVAEPSEPSEMPDATETPEPTVMPEVTETPETAEMPEMMETPETAEVSEIREEPETAGLAGIADAAGDSGEPAEMYEPAAVEEETPAPEEDLSAVEEETPGAMMEEEPAPPEPVEEASEPVVDETAAGEPEEIEIEPAVEEIRPDEAGEASVEAPEETAVESPGVPGEAGVSGESEPSEAPEETVAAGETDESLTEDFLAYAQMIEAESAGEDIPTYGKLISEQFGEPDDDGVEGETGTKTPFDLDEEWLRAISGTSAGEESGNPPASDDDMARELMDYTQLFEDKSAESPGAEKAEDAGVLDIEETAAYDPSSFSFEEESGEAVLSDEERRALERGETFDEPAGDLIGEQTDSYTDLPDTMAETGDLSGLAGDLSPEELQELHAPISGEAAEETIPPDEPEGAFEPAGEAGEDESRPSTEPEYLAGWTPEPGGPEETHPEEAEEEHEPAGVSDVEANRATLPAADVRDEELSIDDLIDDYVSTLNHQSEITSKPEETGPSEAAVIPEPPEPVAPQPAPVSDAPPSPETTPFAHAGRQPSSQPHGEDVGDEEEVTATIAEIYVAQGLLRKAVNMYRKLLEHDPSNEAMRSRLAGLQQQLDRQSEDS